MHPVQPTPLGAAAGTEFQSRLDEGAVRRAQSAADAGDRDWRAAMGMRLQALTAPTEAQAVPADAALRGGARRAARKAPLQLEARLSALLFSAALQLPVPECPLPRLALAPEAESQPDDATERLAHPACLRQQLRSSPVPRVLPVCLRRAGVGDRLHRRPARVQQGAARQQPRHVADVRAPRQARLPELSSRAPTAL